MSRRSLAYCITDTFMIKCMPQDTVTEVELRQMLNKVSMKSNCDLKVIFEQIRTIKNRCCTYMQKIDEDDLIAVMIDAESKEYKAILMMERHIQGAALDLSHLEQAMNQHCR
jgi:hypothetical protein